MRWRYVDAMAAMVLGMLWSAGATAGEATVPAPVLRHAADYTFGYYPYGWRRPGQTGPVRFAVETNQYGLLLDASRGCLTRMGPREEPLEAAQAVARGVEAVTGLPETDFVFAVRWNGRAFPVSAGVGASEQLRLYRVGKYLQHFDLQTLQIGGLHTGAGLDGLMGWMEGYCWSDRLALQFHVASYPSHRSRAQSFDSLGLEASMGVPKAYPIVEALEAGDVWTSLEPGGAVERALIARDEQGRGIAFLAAPDSKQRLRLGVDGRMTVEGPAEPLPNGAVRSMACIVVPSSDVRRDALRELRQMAAAAGQVTVEAEGVAPYAGPLPVRYDPIQGWYEVLLGENPDATVMERVKVKLRNGDPEPRTVRLNFAKIGGHFSITGMSPVLRDARGCPIGLPVQISKNWHCAPPWFSGLAMLELEPGRDLELEFDLAYRNWGSLPAISHAQLCLVGYGGNQLWDEMAVGSSGESICYDPDVCLGRSLVDDMRPLMVWGMGAKQRAAWTWTHNVGGCDFLTLFLNGQEDREFLQRQRTWYASYGPVMTDVTYAGEIPGGAIQSRVRARSWRSDDYVRALYTLRYDVVQPVERIERLAFFQLGADRYNWHRFRRIARGTAAGSDEAWEPPLGGNTYTRRGEELPGRLPWIGVFESYKEPAAIPEGDAGAFADKAMIVREWKARLGGVDRPIPHYSVYSHADPTSRGLPGLPEGLPTALVELSPPRDVSALHPGDYVEAQVEVLILPQRADDYYGPNESLRRALVKIEEPWGLTQREASGTDLEVSCAAGTLEEVFPLRIRAEDGRAEFTVTGGVGYVPLTVAGAPSPGGFELLRRNTDGSEDRIDQSSTAGNDWWQAEFDPLAKTYALTFSLPLDGPDDRRRQRTFVWRAAPEE